MELKNVEKQEKSLVKLTFVVSGEEFRKAVDASYRKNAAHINVPGFRKGKAPRKMLEKLYGEEIFYEDAVNFAYPAAYEQAVTEAAISPIGQADIDIKDLSAEGFTVEAIVPVKPEMTLKAYKGLSSVYDEKKTTESEVKEELGKLADRLSRTEAVERAAKKNDTAVIDFEGFVDGVAFEGGKGENYPLVLGSGQFIPGFEEQLIGKKAGQEVDVNVTFPAEYQEATLAGKEAVFKCKIHEVKQTVRPTIDDDFAKDASEFDTLDELKADLKEKITKAHQAEAEQVYEEGLMDALVENLEGEIPDTMYDAQVSQIMEDFAYRIAMQGMDLDSYLKMTGSDAESLRKMFLPQAQRQVKIRLALEEVAKAESIEVTDADVDAEFKKMAESYGMEEDKVRAAVPVDSLKSDLSTQKAMEFVKENGKKTKAKKAAAKSTEEKAAKTTKTAKKSDDKEEKTTAKKPAAKKATKSAKSKAEEE